MKYVPLLTTELNFLGVGSICPVGKTVEVPIDQFAGTLYFDWITDPRPGFLSVWFLLTLDGGITWEDGFSCRRPDYILSTANSFHHRVRIPPGKFRAAVRNHTALALSFSGNMLSLRDLENV